MRGPFIIEFRAEFSSIEGTFNNHEPTLYLSIYLSTYLSIYVFTRFYTILYYAIVCYTTLFSTLLYSTLLYRTILYYTTILIRILIYSTVLYSSIYIYMYIFPILYTLCPEAWTMREKTFRKSQSSCNRHRNTNRTSNRNSS